ncbi:MAG: regulatory protein RecX [Phycicoccus sp.]|nr:regulatory protein RecX [Phycicoccus sp.]NMM32986.1 regulatory protein RecX [Phycicoccus sp.]
MTPARQDKAARAAAALADALASSTNSDDPAPDPTKQKQKQDREPDPHDVARQIVLRQLAVAPRSRAQLEQKLAQRDCPADVAAAVLDRMSEVGLVDDEAYALMLVRSQQAGRGLARGALARELRTNGIDDELAQQALASISEVDERDRARALVDKKLRAMHGLGIEVQTRRLAGMLARKGYSPSLTYAVIRDAIADAPEYLPD